MALSGDVLGLIVFAVRQNFSNKTAQQLIGEYGSLDNARKQAAIDEYTAVVEYFKANAVLAVPGAGLLAPSGGGPVTGSSNTGTIN
jgi:hypothetical protein